MILTRLTSNALSLGAESSVSIRYRAAFSRFATASALLLAENESERTNAEISKSFIIQVPRPHLPRPLVGYNLFQFISVASCGISFRASFPYVVGINPNCETGSISSRTPIPSCAAMIVESLLNLCLTHGMAREAQ